MAEKFKVISPDSIIADVITTNQTNSDPSAFTSLPTKTTPSTSGSGLGSITPQTTKLAPNVPKKEKFASNLTKAKDLIDKYITNNKEYEKVMDSYDKLTNTEIKDLTDVTSLDLTSELDINTVDFAAKGLPDPADFGLDPSSIVDLSALDATNWDLPLPELAKLDDKCFDGGDMFLSPFVDLEGIDMSGFDLPTFDFGFAGDFEFPDWMDPSNIELGDMFDIGSVDLSGALDLSSVSLPDIDFPDFGNPFDGISLPSMDGFTDGFKDVFGDMGSSGDLIGLGSASSLLNGIKCVGETIVDVLVPDAVVDAVKNFELPEVDFPDIPSVSELGDMVGDVVDLGGIRDFLGDSDLPDLDLGGVVDKVKDLFGDESVESLLKDKTVKEEYKGPILSALAFLSDDWVFDDKEKGIYNYDNIINISPVLLKTIGLHDKFSTIAALSEALKIHRDWT